MMRTPIGLLLMFSMLIAACGSDDASGGNVPDDPIDVATLREQASDLDGETVTVRSNYWSDGQTQYVSDIMMESYPPQIPTDQAVILLGELPAEVLDAMTHAGTPFADVTWGAVEITGVVHAGDELRLEVIDARVIES